MSEFGAIGWNELISMDVEASKRFYREVAGWESRDLPMPDGKGTYVLFSRDGSEVAGMMSIADVPGLPEGTNSHWFTYIQVEDAQAACDAAERTGGKVLRPVFEIPGMAWVAVLQSSDGSVFGAMQPVSG